MLPKKLKLIRFLEFIGLMLLCCVIAAVVWIVVDNANLDADERKKFREALSTYLYETKTEEAMSKLYPGNWSKVCVVGEYDRASALAARNLNIPLSNVTLIGEPDFYGSDTVNAFIFLYPPKSAAILKIYTSEYYLEADNCQAYDAAILRMEYSSAGTKILKLEKRRR